MRICVVCVLILLAGSLIEGSWAQARPINVPLYGDFKYRLPFALVPFAPHASTIIG